MKRLLIAFFAFALTAGATTLSPLPLKELTRISTHIVEAQAVSSTSSWDADHKLIFTYTRFNVAKTLKGKVAGEIIVKQLGGRVGNIEQKLSGVRGWSSGQRAVLFLVPCNDGDGSYVVSSLIQGDFRVTRTMTGEELVSNGAGDGAVEAFDARSHSVSEYRGQQMNLSELEKRIAEVQQ